MTLRVLDFADGFTSSIAPSSGGIVVTSDNQNITSGGTITPNVAGIQALKLTGSPGAVTTSTTPFSSAPGDGTIIILTGQDNTNTVTVPHSDEDGGCILNGDANLGENDQLTLYYELSTLRYKEITRNF